MVTYGYSYAKYVSNHAWNYYLGTKGFYFGSDELGIEKITNVNNNWDFESTYFRVKNSENDYLVTDYDIQYTVKCTIKNDASEYSKCLLNGTDMDTFSGVISSSSVCFDNSSQVYIDSSNKEDCESKGHEWIIQENYKDLYFDIVKTGDHNLDDVSVLIEVTSTSPYKKTLLGEFNLSSIEMQESGLKVDYKEFNNYSRVIISNSYDEDKCVKLNWNSDKLRIDTTNQNIALEKFDDNNNINEIHFNIGRRNSISYMSYKTDFSKTYDNSEFILVESNEC
jgi:hypothetical protein